MRIRFMTTLTVNGRNMYFCQDSSDGNKLDFKLENAYISLVYETLMILFFRTSFFFLRFLFFF